MRYALTAVLMVIPLQGWAQDRTVELVITQAPKRLEHNQDLTVPFELRGTAAIDVESPIEEQISLTLRSAEGKVVISQPDMPWLSPFAYCGKGIGVPPPPPPLHSLRKESLDGSATFRLVELRDLRPGVYTATLNLVVSRAAKGAWRGTVRSRPFRLVIVPEPARTQVMFLPRRLRLRRGVEVGEGLRELNESQELQLYYTKADAVRLVVPKRNGHTITVMTSYPSQIFCILRLNDDPPKPGVIDTLYGIEAQTKVLEYRIEIFETDVPSHVFALSEPKKTLWSRTFKIDLRQRGRLRRVITPPVTTPATKVPAGGRVTRH